MDTNRTRLDPTPDGTHTERERPARRDRSPSADTGKHRPAPVDLSEESAAGEEDPGAGLDVAVDRSKGSP